MADAQLQAVLRHVRGLAGAHHADDRSDGALLRAFAAGEDQAAFTTLVRRHGALVLAVCRRVLDHLQDAEDAFQATFILLARNAASVGKQESAAGWLHEAAYRSASNARRARWRRRRHEGRARVMRAANPEWQVVWREVQVVLDEEVRRLPAIYRDAFVLCCLENQSAAEAARALGVQEGTVRSRLARARARLQEALAPRGVSLSAVLGAAALAGGTASARAPGALVSSTVAAATVLATGNTSATGVVSANVADLLRKAKTAMVLTKLKTAALVVLALAGAGVGAYQQAGARAPEERPVAAPGRVAVAFAGERPRTTDPDSDGDGLPDFHEIHKYRTDPNTKDTAGKGVADGDWWQRREFTYSVRAVIRVMPPYNLAALNDDYQDVRVLKETKEYAELEVVVYPFNTNAEAIQGNPNWKKDYAGMKEYLAPGITTNWDDEMRKALLRELAGDGIDPDKLTDKEVVERVSRWLFKRSQYREMFCTFYVGFRDGKPQVLPGLEKAFEKDKGDPKWTVREQFEHELFGKEMFAHKTYGTCTSTAVYQTTVLRALGIPTRMILCIPTADGSDTAQVEMLEKGLTNHRVRYEASMGAIAGQGFTSHTFCEVFVGGRWRRLNFTTLGQNVLERNYLGLMIHVHTFNDLSEAKLAETWGARYATGRRDETFPRNNPYRLVEAGDHFGKYAKVPNPPAEKEHKQITIGKVYWPDAKDAPAMARELPTFAGQGDGRLFIHGEEWFENAGDYLQYKMFMRRADGNFLLRAKGQADVACQLSMGFVTRSSQDVRELEILIPAAQYAKMAKGVAYTLHPVNDKKGYAWKVREGLTIARE